MQSSTQISRRQHKLLLVLVRSQFILSCYYYYANCYSLHALPHPRIQSTPGYRSHLAQNCGVHLVVGSDQGQIMLPVQMNCSRVCLAPGLDHLFQGSQCSCFGLHLNVMTMFILYLLKGMAPRGKTIQFNQTKKCRFENTLSLCTITTSICKLSIGIIWYKLLSIGRIPHCVFVKEIFFLFFVVCFPTFLFFFYSFALSIVYPPMYHLKPYFHQWNFFCLPMFFTFIEITSVLDSSILSILSVIQFICTFTWVK